MCVCVVIHFAGPVKEWMQAGCGWMIIFFSTADFTFNRAHQSISHMVSAAQLLDSASN